MAKKVMITKTPLDVKLFDSVYIVRRNEKKLSDVINVKFSYWTIDQVEVASIIPAKDFDKASMRGTIIFNSGAANQIECPVSNEGYAKDRSVFTDELTATQVVAEFNKEETVRVNALVEEAYSLQSFMKQMVEGDAEVIARLEKE
jgi:hypothetical protein